MAGEIVERSVVRSQAGRVVVYYSGQWLLVKLREKVVVHGLNALRERVPLAGTLRTSFEVTACEPELEK